MDPHWRSLQRYVLLSVELPPAAVRLRGASGARPLRGSAGGASRQATARPFSSQSLGPAAPQTQDAASLGGGGLLGCQRRAGGRVGWQPAAQRACGTRAAQLGQRPAPASAQPASSRLASAGGVGGACVGSRAARRSGATGMAAADVGADRKL